MVILLPESDIHPIDITVEEAVKILVSGGIVTPDTIVMKKGGLSREEADATR